VKSGARPRLAFVSPLFLFPNDAGGKIRSTNILRGLKGGAFELRLLSPAPPDAQARWGAEIDSVCDEFVPWVAPAPRRRLRRALDLLSALPVNVAADVSAEASACVTAQVARGDIDLLLFDFVHASVLRPAALPMPSVCFTHNVEAEIFRRHADTATNPLWRGVWQSQHRKMRRFEAEALARYTRVVAVSERDAATFRSEYGVRHAEAIPTGVDLDYFGWEGRATGAGANPPSVVFVGSMDSAANIDAVDYFIQSVWPLVRAQQPQARFVVVGRHPPAALVAAGQRASGVEFTGAVPDVRPFLHQAQLSVIPLRVGGGTRIKAFEAMAIGCPVVSTSVGIEGLSLKADEHFLAADDAPTMARHVLALLGSAGQREAMAARARAFVESRFGHREVAKVFEAICLRALRS
jgi:polysaccharide biosynthesis protein PslH